MLGRSRHILTVVAVAGALTAVSGPAADASVETFFHGAVTPPLYVSGSPHNTLNEVSAFVESSVHNQEGCVAAQLNSNGKLQYFLCFGPGEGGVIISGFSVAARGWLHIVKGATGVWTAKAYW
jgi:hypothetical protein